MKVKAKHAGNWEMKKRVLMEVTRLRPLKDMELKEWKSTEFEYMEMEMRLN